MVERSQVTGKLSLAIIESLVNCTPDGTSNEAELTLIETAMQATAARLQAEWAERKLWNAVFTRLPRNKELLADLHKAVQVFYSHPAHAGFGVVLKKILGERDEFPTKTIRKAVNDYVTTLTEELYLADKAFRKNVRRTNDPSMLELRQRVDKSLLSRENRLRQEKKTGDQGGLTEEELPISVEDMDIQPDLTRLAKLSGKRIPRPSHLTAGSRLPDISPRPHFIGRENSLRKLAACLDEKRLVVITQTEATGGLGGVGKTALASEFARRYGQFFSGGVFWLDFSQLGLIPAQVAACGTLPADSPIAGRVKQVLSEWHTEVPRLLIFDNCKDTNLVAEWFPSTGGCRGIVTSRTSKWPADAGMSVLSLEPLQRQESLALLQDILKDPQADPANLDEVAAELKDLPLALHMAGYFLRAYHDQLSPREYLEALRKPRLLKRRWLEGGKYQPSGNDLEMGRALKVSLDGLDEDNPTDLLALQILKRITCLAADTSIPPDLLKRLIGEGLGEGKKFENGLKRLVVLGLVEENSAGDLHIHRLAAAFIWKIIPDRSALTAVEEGILAMAGEINLHRTFNRMSIILPHLKYLTDNALVRKDTLAARLANELGYYLDVVSDYEGARSYYRQALAINRRVLGEEHPDTTVSLNNLGSLLQVMGDFPTARSLFEQALKSRRKVLGGEHPDTAISHNNLGYLLQTMGDYVGARKYFEQALEINRKLLGEEHPLTTHSLNNMGFVLQAMKDYEGSKHYYQEALRVRKKVLGKEHPDTAVSLNNMGYLLQAMGNYRRARTYYEDALAINRKVSGENHPGTAASLNNLGYLLKSRGDLVGARPYYEQALSIRRKVLGDEHPDTATSLTNMGNLLLATGDHLEAQDCFEQALTIRQKTLGEEHPETLLSMNDLARVLEASGNPARARYYFDQAQSIRQRALERRPRPASRNINRPGCLLRTKVIAGVVFIVSVAVVVWQLYHPGPIAANVGKFIATVGDRDNHSVVIFFRPTTIPLKTARPTHTATTTATPTATYTRYIPKTPVFPSVTMVIFNPTNTIRPTFTPTVYHPPAPTSTPTIYIPPVPTSTPTIYVPPVPTSTPTTFFPATDTPPLPELIGPVDVP
jgi:tetratricopeptide (TPR) repeat protein